MMPSAKPPSSFSGYQQDFFGSYGLAKSCYAAVGHNADTVNIWLYADSRNVIVIWQYASELLSLRGKLK
jgi:hypothetical protein